MDAKTLHSACVNKASNTINNETSYWTLEEIQRMSCDVHFLVVKTRRRYAALRSWNVNFILGKGRTERAG
jgi:hypothetical protein